jgi:hypothetical protein
MNPYLQEILADFSKRIAKLENQVNLKEPQPSGDWWKGDPTCGGLTENYGLGKQMNNEPVAWMCPTGLEYKQRANDFMYNDALYDTKLNWIPLYTHPAKTLTDEEIHSLFLSFCNVGFTQVDEIGFARAILRKAQEK